jgi:hypothetical protein
MTQAIGGDYYAEYEDRSFAETPFIERLYESYEEPSHESPTAGEAVPGALHFETPFETSEAFGPGEAAVAAPEIAALAELAADLKDHAFREALEALATEALEMHAERLEGEYGDHEMRELSAERLLEDHFAPLASQAEAMLDRFFERLEGYEAETLTDTEIERIVSEIAPASHPFAPASDQFLGGLLRKASRLVSGAVNLARRGVEGAVSLAGKGLAAVGKLALGPLLKGLKSLGVFLLKHVVRFALGNLPPALQPMARQLSDRLFRAISETYEYEVTEHEQTEAEAVPAGVDVARLEAEFDVAAAQLLLTPAGPEAEDLPGRYGETGAPDRSMSELDDARGGLVRELSRLESGESPRPVMEQFLPAMLWPVAKTAITFMGRPKLVGVLGNLLSGLVKPMIGAQAAGLLAPAIADAGLRIFGLEASNTTDPREVTAEALAATVEETVNRIGEFPQSTLENETLFEAALRDAFEDAAATYFPSSHIKGELRETHEPRGLWTRMPHGTHRKRYAKYSEDVPVTITPRVAEGVRTFGNATLRDHLRDRMDVPSGVPLQTNVRLYQVLPGATTSAIARAEGINPRDLHPLTPHAAGALLGPNAAGLGPRDALAGTQLGTPHQLHLRQRLYYIEPPSGRSGYVRPHARLARAEVSINLPKGEIRLWLYLSEPLAQKISTELGKSGNVAGAFRLVRPLVERAAAMLRSALLVRRMPPAMRIVGEAPNLEHRFPPWLGAVGVQLAAKVAEWGSLQVSQYLRNNAEPFRRAAASDQDGVTLSVTMSRVPGIDVLRQIARGQVPKDLQGTAWLRGEPAFAAILTPGYAIR